MLQIIVRGERCPTSVFMCNQLTKMLCFFCRSLKCLNNVLDCSNIYVLCWHQSLTQNLPKMARKTILCSFACFVDYLSPSPLQFASFCLTCCVWTLFLTKVKPVIHFFPASELLLGTGILQFAALYLYGFKTVFNSFYSS